MTDLLALAECLDALLPGGLAAHLDPDLFDYLSCIGAGDEDNEDDDEDEQDERECPGDYYEMKVAWRDDPLTIHGAPTDTVPYPEVETFAGFRFGLPDLSHLPVRDKVFQIVRHFNGDPRIARHIEELFNG